MNNFNKVSLSVAATHVIRSEIDNNKNASQFEKYPVCVNTRPVIAHNAFWGPVQ